MRKFIYLIIATLTMSVAAICQNKVIVSDTNYPEEITKFVGSHFGGDRITKLELDNDDARAKYDVNLSNDVKLEFDNNMKVIEVKSKSKSKLPDSVIPSALLSFASSNYPKQRIIAWEMEKGYQVIELNNGKELLFDLNGEFIREDD